MLSTRNKARFMSVMTILAMLFSFANVSPALAIGGDGNLDPTFGTNGIATIAPITPGYDHVQSVTIQASDTQADGKLVMTGYSETTEATYQFTTVRYNGNGSLDTSFGGDGIVTTNSTNNNDLAYAVAIQSDGKIVVAGYGAASNYQTQFEVVRYNSDGSLDTSFDSDGILSINPTGYSSTANSVAIQSDGQIVVAGYGYGPPNYQQQFLTVRLNGSDGSLDTSFDGDGVAMTGPSGYSDVANAVAIQSDGRIVVAGNAYGPATNYQTQFEVVRYNSDGSLDTSFDSDGILTLNPTGSTSYVNSVAVQSDGQIVVAGYGYSPATNYQSQFLVARLNGSDGSLDTSFDGDGSVTTGPSGYYDYANSVALQSDGKIVVAGYGYGPPNYQQQFEVVRYNSNGSLDASFDTDGIVTTSVGNYSNAYSVAIQPNGKIVVGGEAPDPQNISTDFAAVRYNNDGSLDTSFDGDGIVTTDIGKHIIPSNSQGMALQSDGKIVVAGASSESYYVNNLTLARLSTDGSPDTSFGGDGIVTTAVAGSGGSSYASSVAIQSDGKIVAAGYAYGPNTSYQQQFAVVRYNSDGSLDTSFGGDGIVTTGVGGSNDYAYAVRIQSDGQIVVAGYAYGPATNYQNQMGVVRLNGNDGSLDTTFDGDGSVTLSLSGGGYDYASSVAIQSDGGIVLAGITSGPTTNYQYQFGVLRLNGSDGSLDTSFGGDGIVTLSLSGGGYDYANSVAIQADGGIVLAGITSGPATNFQYQSGVVRLNGSDGSLDTSFDTDGIATLSPSGGGSDSAYSVAIQSDNRIVTVGYGQGPATNYQYAMELVRYNSDGSLDTSFDTDGIVTTVNGSAYYTFGSNVAIQGNGQIVAGGYTAYGYYGSLSKFMVARYGVATVSNAAPTANAGGPYSGNEGSAIAMSGATASDPDTGDTLTYAWTVNSALCSFSNASALNPTLTCTDNGSFTATLKVNDGVNPNVSSDAAVTVNNANPSASLGNNSPINEGGSANVSFSGATDPSSVDTTAGFHYAFACNGGSLAAATYAGSGTSASTSCAFADNPNHTVSGKIMDKDGGSNEYTTSITVNNVAPTLGVITISTPLVPINTTINASASFTDPGSLDTHTAVWNWEDATTSAGSISPAMGNGTASASHSFTLPGVYLIRLNVTDKDGAVSNQANYEFVVVYDPNAGFVTGGGQINSPAGALVANPSFTGKGTFGFNTKYKKDGSLESETEFELQGGNFHFHSHNAQWLVITGPKAEYQGTGTVEGSNHQFGFTLTDLDGQTTGGGGVDKFRLRIWDITNGNAIVYDNQMGAPVNADPTTPLSKGSIVFHK